MTTHDRLLDLARRRLESRAAGRREPRLEGAEGVDDVDEDLLSIYEDDLAADAIDSGDEPPPKRDDEDDGCGEDDGEDDGDDN